VNRQLTALDTLYVSTAPTPDEVWTPVTSYHVDGLHPEVSRRLMKSMKAVEREQAPIAAVMLGERGSGKTHLLGWTRHEIQARGGFFFYIKLVTGRDFWESATGSLVDSLYRKDEGGQEQLLRLLDELVRRANLDPVTRSAITGQRELTRAYVDAFVSGIRSLDLQVGNEAADTARALTLVASSGDAVEVGRSYLALNDDDLGQRAAWGMSSRGRPAQLVLRDLTRLFALVGPLVFAFDQLDNLVAVSETSLASSSSAERRGVKRLSGDIAAGLMEMREEARRTLMVIACQEDTWQKISRATIRSALDRFEVLPALGAIPDEPTAAAIISRRFRPGYESVGFTPPYPTWPISTAALAEAVHRYTARRLLIRVAEHIAECLQTGTVAELTSLAGGKHIETSQHMTAPATELDRLTELFGKLRSEADDLGPLDKATEDQFMPSLLGAGLRSLVKELGVNETQFLVETDFGGKAALHARLRYTVDEASENEIHWSFRAIASDNPRAAQTRIRNAVVEAGLTPGLASRRLILLRNTQYPGGAKTKELKDDFEARGGLPLPFGAADLRTFAALDVLLGNPSTSLRAWLRQERPATRAEIFAPVLEDLHQCLGVATTVAGSAAEEEVAEPPKDVEPIEPDITIGTTVRGGRPFTVAVELLRKHTVVVGAAGSGKTVLVKRIVEQCALRGVSAIVLDPNDDLARLGDPWPSLPEGWTDEQEHEAQRYFADTEVMVWTPGLSRGRPISFHPLPDFGPVLADEDDFRRLLTSTVAALAPQAGVRGDSARATQQLGVLRRALERYAREGGRTLAGLVELLAEPPSDIVNNRTSRFAVQMADTLEAAIETDPLIGESGAPADPGVLLTPSPGKSARISVISFVGLSGEGPARFVTRLQAALFSWFKAHLTDDRPLGGLLVMDEAQNFVPSGGSNPSTASTVELIRQIRKYGLGIVLASQAPKGINHQALGNTANQFIGRLTAPAQINAAETMAQSRNAVLDNLGGLPLGTFYAAGEGTTFSKIQVPICLSHHAGPLHEDEVLERAHRKA
jgi:Helicase HerA, central domain